MPILNRELDMYPENLFEFAATAGDDPDCYLTPDTCHLSSWYALYTRSRREKDLARRLLAFQIPFYCPIIPQRQRSPSGRIRTSYLPLFTNYVFMYGDEEARYQAYTTNCIARDLEVTDSAQLIHDLRQIRELVELGVPLTRESRLPAGTYVRIKTGPFRNYEGTIIRREGQRRLLVSVNFLEQGASVLLDDCEVEKY